MATLTVAPSPRSGSPASPDRSSKEIAVDAPTPASPFPSPSSSFVPPPMPGAHEFANKPHAARFLRPKKSNSLSAVTVELDSPGSSKDESQSKEGLKEPNGVVPALDNRIDSASLSSGPVTALMLCSSTSTSLSLTPTSNWPSDAGAPTFEPKLDSTSAPSVPLAAEVDSGAAAACGRSTPTQMHISLPPLPSSPSQFFSAAAAPTRTPSGSGSGTASKHTSLSSSRPAPASPSPAPSRRQSGVPSPRSHHRSGHSIASASSSKFGTIKSPSPLPLQAPKRKGEIKIRDFAYPAGDLRHIGRGPDAPKVIKKLLKHHGPLDAGSRRASGMSESSVDSEASSRRSSGFGSWGAFRWASKLGGAWGFGSGSAGRSSGVGNGVGAGGYMPSQQDFERNFDDTADLDVSADPPGDEEDSSDYDSYGVGDAEPEELLPGLYRALYDFEPEGTAEMGLKEGQVVRVVGRGGGVGWAIAVRPDVEAQGEQDAEGRWALVPESYLRVVKLDEAEAEGEGTKHLDDIEQDIESSE